VNEREVRPLNDDVVVRLEIRAQDRRVTVTREALEDFLQLTPKEAGEITMEQRLERVQKNLPSVIAAVHRKIDTGNTNADAIVIFAGEM
jgi:hypothetical protein